MVSHRFPLDDIAEALDLFDGGNTGKVIIEP